MAAQLYRITQEWVNHAAQSAGATNIFITLSKGHKGVFLRITDNDGNRSQEKYVGKIILEMTRHRAEMIGANVVIKKRKRGGMQLTCKPANSKGTYENHGESENHQFIE